jgi:hypothetical protein
MIYLCSNVLIDKLLNLFNITTLTITKYGIHNQKGCPLHIIDFNYPIDIYRILIDNEVTPLMHYFNHTIINCMIQKWRPHLLLSCYLI